MTGLIKAFRSTSKSDFAAKVLDRYSSRKAVGSFARELFRTEDAASINNRFAKAQRKISAQWTAKGQTGFGTGQSVPANFLQTG